MNEWRQLRLKDLGRWFSGGTPPRDRETFWEGELPWLSAKDIADTRLRNPTTFVTEEAARTHSRVLPAGGLLIIVRGMALAHGLPVVQVEERSAFNQDLRGLDCAPGIDPRFVYYSLIGGRGLLDRHIDQAAHGTARVTDSLYTERLAIPELPYQRKVVNLLDRECARIDAVTSEVDALIALLRGAASERVSCELAGLPHVPLRFRLAGIDQGWSPECDSSRAAPGEWGVLKAGSVNYGHFRPEEHKRLPDSLAPRTSAEIHVDDVLMSRANTRELVGSTAIVERTGNWRLMMSDKLYRLRLVTGVDPRFVVFALNSREVRDQIEVATSGASSSMQNISQDLVRRLRIPDGSPEAQAIAVRRLEEARVQTEQTSRELAETRKLVTEYRHALITEAVTDKLDATKLSESQMDESLAAVREGEHPEVLST